MTTLEQSQQTDWLQTELELMSSQEDSPAKTSQPLEDRQALKASAVDYGQSAPVFLGSFDPGTLSLKTSQTCLTETGEIGLSEYSETFPRSGMMRNGTVYQLPRLALTTTEIGSGLLPTPTATANQGAPSMQERYSRPHFWRTPAAIQRVSGSEEQGVLREMQEDGTVFNQSCRRGKAHRELLADTNEFRLEEHGHSQSKHAIQGRKNVAYPSREGLQGSAKTRNDGEDGEKPRNQLLTRLSGVQGRIWETEPDVGRVANGVPSRSHRLKCLGNAVVPQIPELIGRAIKSHLD